MKTIQVKTEMGVGGRARYLYSFHRTELGRHNRLEERKSQVSFQVRSESTQSV